MSPFRAHFDGKVFVPLEPVDLPADREVVLRVEAAAEDGRHTAAPDGACAPEPVLPWEDTIWDWLENNAVDSPALPDDLAHQFDHYRLGTPKKPPV